MYYELSKREKRIAWACIDKGLEAEFMEGLEKSESIIQQWRNGQYASQKEAYHALYETIFNKDKAIARRYDDLTGGRYLATVAAILKDGYISESDINDLSEDTKFTLKRWTAT